MHYRRFFYKQLKKMQRATGFIYSLRMGSKVFTAHSKDELYNKAEDFYNAWKKEKQ